MRSKKKIWRYRIEKIFTYIAPKEGMSEKYIDIRAHVKEAALCINEHCPECPEKETAMLKLEEAVMHANAAIARN